MPDEQVITSTPVAQPSPSGAPTPTADPFVSKVFDNDGKFKDGWTGNFKDEIGESKYFDNFKPGQNSIRDLIKSASGLSKLAGRALIPSKDASEDEWGKVFEAAGIPQKAEDYGLTLDGIEDQGLLNHLKNEGFIEGLQETLLRAKVPLKMAGPIANAILADLRADYEGRSNASKDVRSKLVEPALGKTKWDDAIKYGRESMAKLYNHSDQAPSEEFNQLNQMLEQRGLADHPLIVGLMHRLYSRMNPGKVLVTGGATVGGNRNTGPGVQGSPNYAAAMMPRSLAQSKAMSGGA